MKVRVSEKRYVDMLESHIIEVLTQNPFAYFHTDQVTRSIEASDHFKGPRPLTREKVEAVMQSMADRGILKPLHWGFGVRMLPAYKLNNGSLLECL